MKNLIKYLMCLIAFTFFNNANAQTKAKNITASIKIFGNCGECKDRIQEAAFSVKGVKKAEWNKKTKMLTVVYNNAKCTEVQIKEAIAKVGHDSETTKASDVVYNKLPACCAYRDGVSCKH